MPFLQKIGIRDPRLSRFAAFLFAVVSALPIGAQAAQTGPGQIVDPRSVLFDENQAMPGRRIGWHFDDLLGAYKQAIRENKPLVIVYGEDWCKYCGDMIVEALTCPKVNALAGSAIFGYSAPSRDPGAKVAAKSLGIHSYPSVSVLEPDPKMLREDGRIVGFYRDNGLASTLAGILRKSGWPAAPAAADGDSVPLSKMPVSHCQ